MNNNKPKSPPTIPIHFLMDHLYDLFQRLKHTGNNEKGMNVLEAMDYFSRESTKGRSCTYALKCQKLFTLQDYNDIKEMILTILTDIRRIDGDEFGR